MEELRVYGIYVRADDRGRVIAVNSEGLLTSLDGWVRVGEYESDVPYAQGGAFGGPIMTDDGAYRYKLADGRVVERSPEEMAGDVAPEQEAPTVEQRLTAVQSVAAIVFVTMAESGQIDDATAGEHVDVFEEWQPNVFYNSGHLRRYEGRLYRCVQAHTSQEDWAPDATPALWSVAADPAEEWPDWSQPIGAHDAYAMGDKVSHDGKHWTSNVDGNVWEPGVYGWTEAAAE